MKITRASRKSFNDVYALAPEQLQLGFLKVLKGSYMEEQKEQYGLCIRADHRMKCFTQSGFLTAMCFA